MTGLWMVSDLDLFYLRYAALVWIKSMPDDPRKDGITMALENTNLANLTKKVVA